jgi:ATP-dependent Lon protease
MPVLPIHNAVAVPDSTVYFRPDYYRSMTGREPVEDAKVVLIVTKEPMARAEITPESFYPIGVSGLVRETNARGFVVIELRSRVNLGQIVFTATAPETEITFSNEQAAEGEELGLNYVSLLPYYPAE